MSEFDNWDDEDMHVLRRFDLIDLDRLFANSPGARIINSSTLISQNLSKDFTSAIYQNSDGELGFVPTCQCGFVKGTTKENMRCPRCQTLCSSEFADVLTHTAWLGIPEQMAPVLHPVWYLVLKNWTTLGRRDISLIDIILNPEEDVPDDFAPYLKGRGFWYFYQHADEILDVLLNTYPKTCKKKPSVNWIRLFCSQYRKIMFCRKLPILHNSLHPLKKNGSTLNFVDSTSKDILEAVINLSNETYKEHATTSSRKQHNKMLYEIYSKVMSYYRGLIKEKLGGKQAILRKHCFGSRIHNSFRTVVIPQTTAMRMDEVILPWGAMVNGLKPMIINLLINRHHKSFPDAMRIFMRALVIYDPLVDSCMSTLAKETPGGYLTVSMGRNPTLALGSIMFQRVGGWYKDPRSEVIGINACIVTPGNIGGLYGHVNQLSLLMNVMNCCAPEETAA